RRPRLARTPAPKVKLHADAPGGRTAASAHRPSARLFVGRERELQHLTDAVERALRGNGQVVMVSGEAGIGKTCLLAEVAARSRQRGALVLWGTCAEDEAGRAYGPFHEALEVYVQTAAAAALHNALGPMPGVIARLLPQLSDRLGEVATPVALQPDEEHIRLFDAVSQLLIAVRRQGPLVVVLDDLQWAEPGTLALLRHVA